MRTFTLQRRALAAACLAAAVSLSGAPAAQQAPAVPAGGSVSTGPATDLKQASALERCTNPDPTLVAAGGPKVEPDVFPSNTGTVTSADGKKWTVPAPVQDGPLAVDIFNHCTGTGDNPDWEKQLQTVVIDPDGVEITGFIFADNYFELYVNGRFVAHDPITMVPFNSNVVRFRARYPMTYAIKGVDWETKYGLGMEYQPFNLGDGGLIAYFSDGNGTHGDWRAETFYIAPLDDPLCVRTAGGRDSSYCSQAVRPICAQMNPLTCKALHFPVPADWTSPKFVDTAWPRAIVWRPIEVSTQPAYVRHAKVFGDAEFIWTRNIRLDNLVLARHTVTGPRRAGR